MPELVNMMMFIEHGKPFPKRLKIKGVASSQSLVGYLNYTRRDDSKEEPQGLFDFNDEGYLGYTHNREGSQRMTYTNRGWLKTEQDIQSFKEEVSKSFSKDGDLAWLPIQSFRDYENAQQHGLFKAEHYAAITEATLSKWFNRVGLEKNNMIYWLDYHTNKNHPHVHLVFLEKNKTRSKGMFSQKQIDDFKYILLREMDKQQQLINQTQSNTYDYQFVKQHRNQLKESVTNYLIQQGRNKTNEKISRLQNTLKGKGRLQYGSTHLIDHRKFLDEIVEDILNMDSNKELYDDLKNAWIQLDSVKSERLHTTYTNIQNQEDKKLRKQIANMILSSFKENNHIKSLSSKEKKTMSQKEQTNFYIEQLSASEKNPFFENYLFKQGILSEKKLGTEVYKDLIDFQKDKQVNYLRSFLALDESVTFRSVDAEKKDVLCTVNTTKESSNEIQISLKKHDHIIETLFLSKEETENYLIENEFGLFVKSSKQNFRSIKVVPVDSLKDDQEVLIANDDYAIIRNPFGKTISKYTLNKEKTLPYENIKTYYQSRALYNSRFHHSVSTQLKRSLRQVSYEIEREVEKAQEEYYKEKGFSK